MVQVPSGPVMQEGPALVRCARAACAEGMSAELWWDAASERLWALRIDGAHLVGSGALGSFLEGLMAAYTEGKSPLVRRLMMLQH